MTSTAANRLVPLLALALTPILQAQPCTPQLQEVGGHTPVGAYRRVDGMVSHPWSGTPSLFAVLRGLPNSPWDPPDQEAYSYVNRWDNGWTIPPYGGHNLFHRNTTLLSYIPSAGSQYPARIYTIGFPPLIPNVDQRLDLRWAGDGDEYWTWWDMDLGRTQFHGTPIAMTSVPFPASSNVVLGGDFRDDWFVEKDLVLTCWDSCEPVTNWLSINESSNIRALAFYAVPPSNQLELYAGGTALHQQDGTLVRWDGFGWQVVPMNPPWEVLNLKVHNGSLWITTAAGLFRYNENGFQQLPDLIGIECIEWFNDGTGEHLYAGGSFQLATNGPMHQVAMFDGTAWRPIAEPFSDSEVQPSVGTLLVHDFGQGPRLVAAGSFQRLGNRLLDNMAVWENGTWRSFGDAVLARSAVFFDDGTGRDLYEVTWSIRSAYNPRPDRVVRLHNGEVQVLGDDFPLGSVLEHIYVFDLGQGPQLIVVGDFSQAPGGVLAKGIVRWDGAHWQPVGPVSTSDSAHVREARLWDEDGPGPLPPALYVTGEFNSIGGVPARNVARWDGTSWSALGDGLVHPGAYMTTRHYQGVEELDIATTSSDNIGGDLARWNGHWTVTDAPTYYPYDAGAMMAAFDAGSGPDIYLSSFNNLNRFDGTTWSTINSPSSGIWAMTTFNDGRGPALYLFGGAAGPPYGSRAYRYDGTSFEQVPTREDTYDAVPSIYGGSPGLLLTSGPSYPGASFLAFCHSCGSPDFNCDGDVGTDQDIEAFFACLAGSCPPPPCTNSADFNGDGDVGSDQDIDAFFHVLAGGSC